MAKKSRSEVLNETGAERQARETAESAEILSQADGDPIKEAMIDIATESEQEREDEEQAAINQVTAKAVDKVGATILSECAQALSAAKVPVNKHTEHIMARLSRVIKAELRNGYMQIMRNDTPMVIAAMGKTTFALDKIQATLEITRSTGRDDRHALSDFVGRDVIVVMPLDVDEYFEGMDAIAKEASELQTDMFAGEPEPPEETPPPEPDTNRVDLESEPTQEEITEEEEEPAEDLVEQADDDALVTYHTADGPIQVRAADEPRLVIVDGYVSGFAPDPDCQDCAGAGLIMATEEGPTEACHCTEFEK